MQKKIIPPASAPPPCICKNFNVHQRKKNENKNYVEFDFNIGNVFVIFSFF